VIKLPYIRASKKFYGKYEVVVDCDKVVPCFNIATARFVKKNYRRKERE
tara:strand:+ start:957 stop:1103 length:147 start_codon:yes stop_codon:yes gene_type:complete